MSPWYAFVEPVTHSVQYAWVMILSSPAKLAVWVSNRAAAWTGLAVVWRKLKGDPQRTRRFILWMIAINVVSLVVLVALFRLLTHR